MKAQSKLVTLLLIASLLVGLFPPAGAQADAADGRKSLEAPRALTSPIIDGSLAESIWDINEPLTVEYGPGDMHSSKFGVMWDYEYLYIAVETEDANLATANEGTDIWWQQANVSLFIDPTLHQSGPYVGKDIQLGFTYRPGTTTPEFSFGAAATNTGRDEKQVLRAITTTDKGWNAEIAIAWDLLGFDPFTTKELGLEVNSTSRSRNGAGELESPFLAWNPHDGLGYWNNTSKYGVLKLSEQTVADPSISSILLDENFDGYADGTIPPNWISNVNGASPAFGIVNDGADGRLVFDGNAKDLQSRVFAPVQWDNYIVEADLKFEGVLNNARWASVMYRGKSAGLHPYNQMAVRQNGTYELALRNDANGWVVPISGSYGQALALNKDYSFKVRVYDNHVQQFLKPADAVDYTTVVDRFMDSNLLERGKVGFQADQSKVSFANLKVTRITADSMDIGLPSTVEALTGPLAPVAEVTFSDGQVNEIPVERVKWYTSDNNVIRLMDGKLYPAQPGTAEITAIYGNNAIATATVTVTPSTTGRQATALTHAEGYLLVTAGEELDLAQVAFAADFNDFTSGQVAGNEVAWTIDAAAGQVADGKLTVTNAGVYAIQVQAGTVQLPMFVVAKAAGAEEYVLYEHDFSTDAGTGLPAGWNVIEGTSAQVVDGKLVLDATSSGGVRVLLPEYLGLFGNYRIDATITNTNATDIARWNSIMYRIQNNNYPYYQMAVRKDATADNGVEFAERTPANGWNVMEKNRYSEAISDSKMYNYSVKVHGNRVQQFIDGQLLINTDLATAYTKGRIGLQANNSIMKVGAIKVALQQAALPPMPPSPVQRIVEVAEPETSINMAPTTVQTIENSADLAALSGDKKPATAIIHVNEQLQAVHPVTGQPFAELDEVMEALDQQVIAAFYLHNEATITPLVDYMKAKIIVDAFVISDKPELVKQARTAYPIVRGIIDFHQTGADLTDAQLMDIRRATNANLAKVALLPAQSLDRDRVEYLQRRLITVWATYQEEAGLPANIGYNKLITSGVNGIVSQDAAGVIAALEAFPSGVSLVRKPWIIGHRGIPALAPENTLEGAIKAYEHGADMIENDIYLTKDGQIVIMHDGTLERTTNGTGGVENYTLAELKQLYANKQFPLQYPDARIPTLIEFFEYFKDKDMVHFVEIKTGNANIIPVLVDLIKQYEVEDQVVIIAFGADQIARLHALMPGMSSGFLTGGQMDENLVNRSVYQVLDAIQSKNTTYNPSYGGMGSKFLEAIKHRGVTSWPWTYRDLNETATYFSTGVHGMTTDYSHFSEGWVDRLEAVDASVQLSIGESTALKATARNYKGETSEVTPEVTLLSGNHAVEINNNEIVAKAAGTAYVSLRYATSMTAGRSYYMYSQPVAITVAPEGNRGQVIVTGPEQVNSGAAFTLQVGTNGVADEVIAQLVKISFDPQAVNFTGFGMIRKPGYQVLAHKVENGELSFVAFYTGTGNMNGTLIDLEFEAVASVAGGITAIPVNMTVAASELEHEGDSEGYLIGSATHDLTIVAVDRTILNTAIANAQALHNNAVEGTRVGEYPVGSKQLLNQAILAAKAVAEQANATVEQMTAAVNSLNEAVRSFRSKVKQPDQTVYLNIGDLASVAKGYGKKQTDADWNLYAHLDYIRDGEIDIKDLVYIAKRILNLQN